ncbi:hypothetical protein CPS_1141 [Colwellia psychrerythraea 34H]|uniref:Uncharacterized protein n=1 Tax=Colwellia psychrerythraea (strain 34H / ATCC BAA-681) TaxID=167879 RepID=Q486Y1_COLP3|nr:hypothetical protein CPS_1141 [Colwellia psychrerythraea 34H]
MPISKEIFNAPLTNLHVGLYECPAEDTFFRKPE